MFFWNFLAFLWYNKFWQFDLWFLCLFSIQLEHMEFHSLCIVEDLPGYFGSMWDECNCAVVVHSLKPNLWGLQGKWHFQSCGHCWVFHICWHIECSTLKASSFKIWNRSAGIPSLPLALFVVMLPKAHLTSHYRIYGSRWLITSSWSSGLLRSFLYSSSVYYCHLFLISNSSVSSLLFLSFIVPIFAWNFP